MNTLKKKTLHLIQNDSIISTEIDINKEKLSTSSGK